ncbi:MAG TPA: hypothetical protein VNO31_44140 [Umezawaea sp.]|nr:hypothetical protein [Umezawaea sp.]
MGAQRFRKKPVEIEAIQFDGNNQAAVSDFMGTSPPFNSDAEGNQWVVLTTVHGEEAIARVGDWIIPEPVVGRFYPCKPDIFAATYEAIG